MLKTSRRRGLGGIQRIKVCWLSYVCGGLVGLQRGGGEEAEFIRNLGERGGVRSSLHGGEAVRSSVRRERASDRRRKGGRRGGKGLGRGEGGVYSESKRARRFLTRRRRRRRRMRRRKRGARAGACEREVHFSSINEAWNVLQCMSPVKLSSCPPPPSSSSSSSSSASSSSSSPTPPPPPALPGPTQQ